MTYFEIFNRVYDGSRTGDKFLATQDAPTRRAWAALRCLSGRKGFDYWFDELDEDLQDDVFQELEKALAP